MANATEHVERAVADERSDENRANSTQDEFKRLVEEGYDQIALRYLEWNNASFARMKYLHKLLDLLPEQAEVLELGCGAGVPYTQILSQRARVTANDISGVQIALVRQHVPDARLIHADMMSLSFPLHTFDAVVAFYSVIHLPRAEQEVLLTRLSDWLRPGGYLVVNLATQDDPGSVQPDWLGSPMYWSSYDAGKNLEIIRRAGLTPIKTEIISDNEDGELVSFLWVIAKMENMAQEGSLAKTAPVEEG